MTREAYSLYDAIWTRRVRITPALADHGSETVREINLLMPNFLTHDPNASPIDEVAADFCFESDNELIEFLLAYKPRGPIYESFLSGLLEQCLGGLEAGLESGAADVPF